MSTSIKFNERNTCFVLFILSFIYMNFFTLAVPYFWDCPLLIFRDPANIKNYIKQAFTITQGRFEGDRPVMDLFFCFNTLLFGKDFFCMRIVKNLFFASYIVFSYILIWKFIRERFYALIGAAFILFSFPVFIHTSVFSEPFIYTEPLKIFAFLLFLKDFSRNKSLFIIQILIAVLLHLTFKSYAPNYSAWMTLLLFILFYDYRKIKRYAVLIIYLAAVNFPLGKLVNPLVNIDSSRVNFNITQFYAFFIENTPKNIFSPSLFGNIYYKSFIQVFTPVLFLVLAFYCLRLFLLTGNKFLKENRFILCFILAYLLPELVIWFFLPEAATRYFSSQILPIALYISLIFFSANKYLKNFRPAKVFLIFVFGVYIGYNLLYTYLYRATWLSCEIGKRKVADYIETIRTDNTLVLFQAENGAPGYIPLNSKGDYYNYPRGIEYKMPVDYNAGYLKTLKDYAQVYIIQKETSFYKRMVPDIEFSNRQDLELIAIINGKTNSLFDKINSRVCTLFSITYQPNKFYIYKYLKTKA